MAEIVVATIMRPEGDTGVQTHFCTFLQWLKWSSYRTTLVTPYSVSRYILYPVFAIRRVLDRLNGTASVWWYRHWHTYFLELALRTILADGQPRVVYAQCPLSAAAAMRARRNTAQKVVLVVHFNLSQADEWAGKKMIANDGCYAQSIRAFEAETLPGVDGLVFVSEFMHQELLMRIPTIAKVPFVVVPNFVSDPGQPQHQGEPDGDLLIVGTLEPRKNQTYALEIIAAAKRHGTLLSLTVAGDGPDRTKLEELAGQLGINEQVRFLGFVRNAAQLFERHRACLHTARVENLPLTLIEAFSRGVPVFAPAVGGVPEVLTDGCEGSILPLDAPNVAAAKLSEWFESGQDYLTDAGERARTTFLERFESKVAAARLLGFLVYVADV